MRIPLKEQLTTQNGWAFIIAIFQGDKGDDAEDESSNKCRKGVLGYVETQPKKKIGAWLCCLLRDTQITLKWTANVEITNMLAAIMARSVSIDSGLISGRIWPIFEEPLFSWARNASPD